MNSLLPKTCTKPASSILIWMLAVLFLATGCNSKKDHSNDDTNRGQPVPVQVQQAQNSERTVFEEVPATVQARLSATIEAKVSGRIDQLPVVLGQRVRKGDLLVHLDALEFNARLEQAEAALQQADRDWKRISGLFEQTAVARADSDNAQSRLRAAKAAAAEAAVLLGDAQITAPFDGVITRKLVDVGDLAGPGKPLVAIENPSLYQLEADVPQSISSHIQLQNRLEIALDGMGQGISGLVTEIAPTADAASRTVHVKLDLPPTAGVISGQFARLKVPTGTIRFLSVPAQAVIQRGQLEVIFVVVNNRAQLHLVRTGKRIGDQVDILSGLESGSQVVVKGAELLRDNQSVEVK